MRLFPLVLLGLTLVALPFASEAAARSGGGGGQHRAEARQAPRMASLVARPAHAPARATAVASMRPAMAAGHRATARRPVASRSAARPAPRALTWRPTAPQAVVRRSAPMQSRQVVARDWQAASATGNCGPRGVQCRRSAGLSWTRGLPPPAGVQANECPDGTMATLARGHADIVRCLPI